MGRAAWSGSPPSSSLTREARSQSSVCCFVALLWAPQGPPSVCSAPPSALSDRVLLELVEPGHCLAFVSPLLIYFTYCILFPFMRRLFSQKSLRIY